MVKATCGTCWRVFSSYEARQQHMDALGHDMPDHECDTCDRYFGSVQAVKQHMDALGHWAQDSSSEVECQSWFDCRWCDEEFATDQQLIEHEEDDHNYCRSCDRWFQNQNNLRQHLNSRIHRGTDIICPFCRASFPRAAGVVYHLERTCCPKAPLDRETLHAAIRQRDPQGIITRKLIAGPPKAQRLVTDKQFNYDAGKWECVICGRQFWSESALENHLMSPAHEGPTYHCPKLSCRKMFTTLAGLVQHLESESCGFMRFDGVQNIAQDLIDPNKRIAFG